MPSVTIRVATPKDLGALGRLAAQLVRMHHTLDPARFMLYEPLEEGYRHWLGKELSDPAAIVLVAVQSDQTPTPNDETVVGYAYGRLEPQDWNALREECGILHDLFVDTSARGRGIAKQLVNAMVQQLANRGAPRVVLSTAWSNETAQRLFQKLGFRNTMIEMTREIEHS